MGERKRNNLFSYGVTADDITSQKRIAVFPASGGKSVAGGRYDQRREDADEAIRRIANENNLNGAFTAVIHGWLATAEETVTFAASPAAPPVEVVF